MQMIRTHHKHPQGRVFAHLVFIYGLGMGMILPIFPNFIRTFFHSDTAVSIFYALMAVLMFIGALASTMIFRKVQRTKITKMAFLVSAIVYFSFIFITKIHHLFILETIKVWLHLFILMTLSLYVRDFTRKNRLAEEEGRYYRFQAVGSFLGPLIGGFIATLFGYELDFLLASIVLFTGLAYFYHLHVIQQHKALVTTEKTSPSKFVANIKTYFKDPGRTKIMLISVAFMCWVRFKRIYIPLYIFMSGYLESLTGIILALSILPLILMEVKVGEYADKHGVRLPITLGFAIMSTLTLIVFFSPYHFINFFILAAVNIGGAMIEPLQEYTLFKHLPEDKEDEMYGVYMTADPIAFFLTPGIAALILFFLPFKYIFLFFGAAMFIASLASWSSLKRS